MQHTLDNINQPLISVITVVLNGDTFIEETILSIQKQSYENIEFIIIDGGSSDQTINIIKKYEHLIDTWISEPDDGIYYAMNKGASLAKGSFLCFLNSSDGYYPNTIENFATKLIDNNYDYSFGPAVIQNEAGEEVRISHPLQYNELFSSAYTPMPSPHLAVFIKKSFFIELEGYDTNFLLSADYDLLLRMIKKSKKIFYFTDPVGFFKLGGVSNSINGLLENYRVMQVHRVSLYLRLTITIKFILRHFLKKILPLKILTYIQSQK
ncbi:glycosyltransferase [Gammaproteobacteria bacterium]|nr:glycosyltransferase [Gammaproteobacteria bacterium]